MSLYLTEDQLRVFMEAIKSDKELTPVIFTTQPTDLELRIKKEVMDLLGDASEIEGFSDPENKGKLLDVLHEIQTRLKLLWGE